MCLGRISGKYLKVSRLRRAAVFCAAISGKKICLLYKLIRFIRKYGPEVREVCKRAKRAYAKPRNSRTHFGNTHSGVRQSCKLPFPREKIVFRQASAPVLPSS